MTATDPATAGRATALPAGRFPARSGWPWVILALLVPFVVAASSTWIAIAGDGHGADTDFGAWFFAGRIVADGEGDRLYDLSLQQELQHAGSARDGSTPFRPFVNPPHAAAAMQPLAALDGNTAYVVWNVVNIALLLGLAWATASVLRNEPLAWRLVGAAATAGGGAVTVALIEGSLGVICGVGLAAVVVGTVEQRHGVVAAGVVAASVKPHFLLLVLLVLLVQRRWAPLWRAAVAVTAVAAATVPLVGLDAWLRYPAALLAYGGPTAEAPELAGRWWNVAGAVVAGTGGAASDLAGPLGWTTFVASVVVVAIVAWRHRRADPARVGGGAAPQWGAPAAASTTVGLLTAAVFASIVFAAHANPQDTVVVPFLAALVWSSLRHDRPVLEGRARQVFGLAAVAWPFASQLAALSPGSPLGTAAVVVLLTMVGALGVGLVATPSPLRRAPMVAAVPTA